MFPFLPLAPEITGPQSEHLYPASERRRAIPVRDWFNKGWFAPILLAQRYGLRVQHLTQEQITNLIVAAKSKELFR